MQFDSKTLRLALLAAAPALALSLAACTGDQTQPAPTAIATIEAESTTAAATVLAVDLAARKLTLRWAHGDVTTYTVGPDVVNFPQIKVGDIVNANVAESFAVYIGPENASPAVGSASRVAVAAKGQRPGVVFANTVVVVDRLSAVNMSNRTVTLQGISGISRTLRVAPGLNMSGLRVGDEVAVRVSEAVAIWVEKP